MPRRRRRHHDVTSHQHQGLASWSGSSDRGDPAARILRSSLHNVPKPHRSGWRQPSTGHHPGTQAKAIALKKQSDELPAKQAELQALSERLPDDAGVAQIIRQITSVAAESGVTLNEFTPSAPAGTGSRSTQCSCEFGSRAPRRRPHLRPRTTGPASQHPRPRQRSRRPT